MIKMILSDLDETLLVDFHVPSINRDAIAKARKKGVHFAVASGRARFMVQSILAQPNARTNTAFVITVLLSIATAIPVRCLFRLFVSNR